MRPRTALIVADTEQARAAIRQALEAALGPLEITSLRDEPRALALLDRERPDLMVTSFHLARSRQGGGRLALDAELAGVPAVVCDELPEPIALWLEREGVPCARHLVELGSAALRALGGPGHAAAHDARRALAASA